MKPLDLAHALKNAISDGLNVDTAVKNFIAALKRRGMLNILPKVLLQLQHIEDRASTCKPSLSVAKEADYKSALKEFGANEADVTKNIDNTLIGGYKLEKDGKLTDTSYKRQLLDIFYKIKNL